MKKQTPKVPKEWAAYIFGSALGDKYKLFAPDKLTAYAAMIYAYKKMAHTVIIYEPAHLQEQDGWAAISGEIMNKVDFVFGGPGTFHKYVEDNLKKIESVMVTIHIHEKVKLPTAVNPKS